MSITPLKWFSADLKASWLNKIQVHQELENIKKENERKIQEIEKENILLMKENRQLTERLKKLEEEAKTEMKSIELMDYSLMKAERYIQLFEQAAAKEVVEVISIGEKIESLFNEKISAFDHSIMGTQTFLESLLKDTVNKNESIEEQLIQFITEEGSYKFLASTKDHNSGINRIISHQKREDGRTAQEFTVEQEVHREEEYLRSIPNNPIQVEPDEHGHKENEMQERDRKDDSFWDFDFEEAASIDQSVMKIETDIGTDMNIDEEKERAIIAENQEDTKNQYKTEEVEQKKGESQAIAKEINTIRNKYLIGKISGTDLTDKSGEILVSKGETITKEIIDKADKEGKLAELILNMTLPDVAV